jgi:hypothetical protein
MAIMGDVGYFTDRPMEFVYPLGDLLELPMLLEIRDPTVRLLHLCLEFEKNLPHRPVVDLDADQLVGTQSFVNLGAHLLSAVFSFFSQNLVAGAVIFLSVAHQN